MKALVVVIVALSFVAGVEIGVELQRPVSDIAECCYRGEEVAAKVREENRAALVLLRFAEARK